MTHGGVIHRRPAESETTTIGAASCCRTTLGNLCRSDGAVAEGTVVWMRQSSTYKSVALFINTVSARVLQVLPRLGLVVRVYFQWFIISEDL